ncbi:histidine kinase [Xanthomonas sp. 1678]|uniref:sensor histidine kinase n=1 Tax=Xanthomonas sp. 1678 TaxID=3158788 RepID=UPI00286039D7|nr:two-component system sensor histidine kinase AlgZ [Xanthomonas translucens]
MRHLPTPAPMRPATARHTPLDILWQPATLIWVLLAGEAVATILTLAPGQATAGWVHFGLASLLLQWTAFTTLAILYLVRAPLERCRPQQVAYLAVALLVIIAVAVHAVAWAILKELTLLHGGWHTFLLKVAAIALTLGLMALLAFQNHWRVQQLAVQAKQAQLEALRARIRPHFLFNTLNTGAALARFQPAQAERLLLDLADLFRAALAGPERLSLEEELSLVRRYLDIEKMRLGERLTTEWQLPDPLPQIEVPTLSIQPLVENAIRHGIEPSTIGGYVRIRVGQDSHWITIEIVNSLPTDGNVASGGHRIGLDSVRARVESTGNGKLSTRHGTDSFVSLLELPRPQ